MKTLEWVVSHEMPTGGIEAWHGSGQAYPEVTGYLIPTLLNYGQYELANRLAKWLVSKQQREGGWLGLDGQQHVFDTSAILQGLQCVYSKAHAVYLIEPIIKAERFIQSQRTHEGYFRRHNNGDDAPALYTCRSSGIIQDEKSIKYWLEANWFTAKQQRPHYIAYALEGLQMAGKDEFVLGWLEKMRIAITDDGSMPFYIDRQFRGSGGTCTTATCQFAILYSKYGMKDYARILKQAAETVLQPDGGLKHGKDDPRCISWAAKYYLDLCKEII